MNARVTANISPFSPALKGRSGGADAKRSATGNAGLRRHSYFLPAALAARRAGQLASAPLDLPFRAGFVVVHRLGTKMDA